MRPCDPDAAAFTELFHAHFHRVYVNLRRLGVPEGAVDDALQEVFIVVLRRHAEAPLLSERAWILGVARRIAHRWRRGAARQRKLAEALAHEPREPLDGAAAVAQQQATRLLEQFLGRLDDDKRAVFVLAELEQLTAPEIAEALQLNLNTVYSRLRAARQVFDRSFARARLRDARTTGEAAPEVALLSRARAAYSPEPGAQARALALLVPLLLVPAGAAQAAGLAKAGLTKAGPAPALARWTAWGASLGFAGVITAGVLNEPAPREPTSATPTESPRRVAKIAATGEIQPAKVAAPEPPPIAAPMRSPPRRVAPPAPSTEPAAIADPLRREAALLAEARCALRSGDPAAAQALLERHAREFPAGALQGERQLSQIAVLCLSGQVEHARAEARRLAHARPELGVRAAALCPEVSPTDVTGSGD